MHAACTRAAPSSSALPFLLSLSRILPALPHRIDVNTCATTPHRQCNNPHPGAQSNPLNTAQKKKKKKLSEKKSTEKTGIAHPSPVGQSVNTDITTTLCNPTQPARESAISLARSRGRRWGPLHVCLCPRCGGRRVRASGANDQRAKRVTTSVQRVLFPRLHLLGGRVVGARVCPMRLRRVVSGKW
ncbi:uncharacterized protein J3D65DRAFT_7036 [Phyllosticta citribraziliensis]|uniref:Secreted protein n=1 Tax=Phyllosticta citribraziliensis TaxID=989973 RepID=A0ABR1M8B5_9PEZI